MKGDQQNEEPTQELEVLEPLGRNEVIAQSAEISQQVSTARAYPRRTDPVISREIVSRATLNDEIAGECMFLLPRGGKTIPGPSIRFAEIVRASYGNIRVATRFVRLDTDDRENCAVIVEAIAYDMQTNNSETVFERRSVMTSAKQGQKPRMYSADMIAQTAGAARSIARRNAVLAVVPKALWIDGYFAAVEVARGSAENLQERREKVFAAFRQLGVKDDRLCSALGLKEESEITLEHMPTLMAMYAAIRDGETADSVFDRLGADVKHDVVTNPLKETVRGNSAAESAAPKEHLRDGPEKPKPATIEAEVVEQKTDSKLPSNEMQQTVQDDDKAEMKEPAKPQAQAQPSKEPETPEAYIAAFEAFASSAKSESSIRDTWGRQAPLRKKLSLNSDQVEHLATVKEKAMAALRKGD